MKKFAILAAVLLLCTACDGAPLQIKPDAESSVSGTEAGPAAPEALAETKELSYPEAWASERLDLPDMLFAQELMLFDDSLLIAGLQSDENRQKVFSLYTPESGVQPVNFHCLEKIGNGVFIDIRAIIPEDEGYTVVYSYAEADENSKPGEETYFAEQYDLQWNYQGEIEITSCLDPDGVLNQVEKTEDGYCLLEHAWGAERCKFLDKDWQELGRAGQSQDYPKLIAGTDGSLYLGSFNGIERVQPETMDIAEITIADRDYIGGWCSGYGEIFYCLWDETGIYGFKADGTEQKLLDWMASDMNGTSVVSVQMLSEQCFAVCSFGKDEGVWLFTPRPESDQTIITLSAARMDDSLVSAVNAFNRQSKTIRIAAEEISQEDLEKQMLSGNMPDILCTDGFPYENYIHKGVLEELSGYMEADADFQNTDYLMNFFDAQRYDGGLYSLSHAFQIYTVAGKTEFVGNKEGLSLEEYNSLAQSLPEGMMFTYWPTVSSVFSEYCLGAMQSFVDVHTARCHFDTPEMMAFLEFCNTFPDDRTIYSDGSAEEGDPQTEAVRNNEICLVKQRLFSAADYHNLLAMFGGESVTLVGMPTADGSSNGAAFKPESGLALSSQSEHKAEAWAFFRFLLSEEYQNSLSWSFPVRRSALQRQMDASLTPEEAESLTKYLERIQQTTYQNQTVSNIVREEAEMYFAGDQTAEAAAKAIQGRVEIYLAEQY